MSRARVAWDATPYLKLDLKVEGQHQRSEMGQPEGFGSLCQPNYAPIDPDHCTDALGYSDRDRDPVFRSSMAVAQTLAHRVLQGT